MVNSFDGIANSYDVISSIIFGRQLKNTAKVHFNIIPRNSSVLLLGGGSGYCLTQLDECDIDFLEKSSNMTALAKKRVTTSRVNFVLEDFLLWHSEKTYDFVLCPFFLDVFHEANLAKALEKIRNSLHAKSSLIVTDFNNVNTIYFKALLKIMHLFFKITSNLETGTLLPLDQIIKKTGFEAKSTYFTRQKFIFSIEYRFSLY